jgi:hypothetical protein
MRTVIFAALCLIGFISASPLSQESIQKLKVRANIEIDEIFMNTKIF